MEFQQHSGKGSPRSRPGWIYGSPWRAGFYELWGALTESRAAARALAVANPRPGDSVLEVAVGTGALFARLADLRELKRCVGVEFAAPMLDRARRRLISLPAGHAALCQGDARRLPFPDTVFDVVLNCYMLDLLSKEGLRAALKEFRRVLKPAGKLALLVMAKQNWLIQPLWMGLYSLSPALVGGCQPIPLEESLASEGWRVEQRERISQNGFRSDLWHARPA